jgi:uncharacterized membrane protein YedE/YeeE
MVPLLLLLGNRQFGVSSCLRAMCAALLPTKAEFFRYDWRRAGAWSLAFVGGIALGGLIASASSGTEVPAISAATRDAVASLGVSAGGLAPPELFSWSALLTVRGVLSMVGGGLLLGFGTAYAGGCTSGHGIAGLATLQVPSLIGVMGFFAGGLLGTFLIIPLIV